MDEQAITVAYAQLTKARLELWGATERTIRARLALEHERGARLMTGEIVGKNEAEREARARELLTSLYGDVEISEADERRARLEADLARIEVDRIEAVLRLLSMTKSG